MESERQETARRVGQVLVEAGRVNAAQLEHALGMSKRRGMRLGEVLVELGLIEEEDLAAALATKLGLRHLSLENTDSIDESALGLIPEALARRHHMIALDVVRTEGDNADKLVLALSDPTDARALSDVQRETGLEPLPVVATISDIDAALESAYDDVPVSLEEAAAELKATEQPDARPVHPEDVPVARHVDRDPESPAVMYIDSLLHEAMKMKASDVHIEPQEFGMRVRFRIDGVLRNMPAPPARFRNEVITRLKILSELDIAERRLPQSGSLRARYGGRSVDARVSTMPGVMGEKVVIRLLDKSRTMLDLDQLGFEEKSVRDIRRVLKAPHGIFLLCGPTGCGKTTTMYSFIREMDRHANNIVTVEDPVEYHISGIHQTHVRAGIGLDFAECLRTMLRLDPDIMMVGEIRDIETLQVAVRASLTGHPVFSTLHTNTAISSVTRMKNMGLRPYLISATMNAALSQQLVRRVCARCATRRKLSDKVRDELTHYFGQPAPAEVPKAHGCEECGFTGYRGRLAVEELFELDDEVRRMVTHRATEQEIRDYMRGKGMKTLLDHAYEKLSAGITTVAEILSLGFHPQEPEAERNSTPSSIEQLEETNEE